MSVTIIESDRERCLELAAEFPDMNIICGDARSQSILESEGIANTDALVTLTGLDELNMMISMYAKNRKIPQVITRTEYLDEFDITSQMSLGSMICPKNLCCNNIVRYVRALHNQSGAAVTVHSIADGHAEALEFEVNSTTLYCGEPLKKIPLRKNILLVSITNGSKTEIPNGDSTFSVGDTVVVVASGDTVIGQLNDIFA